MIDILITRSDLERSVPVSTSKDDHIFDLLSPSLSEESERIQYQVLGDPGCRAYDTVGRARFTLFVKKVVCLRAFTRQFRSLDLVLTATGFGVVSTQDLAPASKMRTDALLSQLQTTLLRAEASLVRSLFTVEGWWNTPQRVRTVRTLFWNVDLFEQYAGKETVTINDWRLAQPVINAVDAKLRQHVSDALVDALLAIHCGRPAEGRGKECAMLTSLIQSFIGQHVAANRAGTRAAFRQVMAYLDNHTTAFSEYAESDAYKANHYEGYANTADSTAFFFQG